MGKATLVVMAAGIGSRFGGGIKQLEPIGPNGELIIDYSIYDAVQAGFDKVIFVIRKDLEKEFKEIIGDRMERIVEVCYAYQEIGDVPPPYAGKAAQRTKPWGTGQAVLVCKDLVREPFLVINSDDYYGKTAYQKAFDALTASQVDHSKLRINMVGFVLENTLSDNGTVTRGVCREDQNGMLVEVAETYEIQKQGNCAAAVRSGEKITMPLNVPVSMNMWGLYPEFFEILENGFREFLDQWDTNSSKNEYLLPIIIGELLEAGKIEVEVLHSDEQWFGVTYKEDKELVVTSIKELIKSGIYPQLTK